MHEPGAATAPAFASKAAMYDWLTKQAVALVECASSKLTPQANLTIGLANVAALYFYELNRFADPAATLQEGLPVNWFGFYLLQGAGVLALGPFQGRPACTQIRIGRGVCGKAAAEGTTLVVADVHAFADHIACDSASQSEVVVPIKLPADSAQLQQQQQQSSSSSHKDSSSAATPASGAVLGVIDVDSTRRSHFDADDAAGLERLAEVLVTHLHFPGARALTANPTLASAQPRYIALSPSQQQQQQQQQEEEERGEHKDAAATAASQQTTIPAAVTAAAARGGIMRISPGIAFAKIEALQPDTTTKTFAGWTFTITRLDRIVAAHELAALEADLGIGAFPEIQFPHNTLRIARANADAADAADASPPLLLFDVSAVLRNARAFYTTAQYTREVAPQLVIPVSETWANSQYARYDAKVDWAWRNNYFGVPRATAASATAAADDKNANDPVSDNDGGGVQLRVLPPDAPGINWQLLSDRQLPILLYDAFDLFEDDLHDSGLVRCSVKFRAMPTAFYVLFRHLVRVDGHEVWLREVRCYHEFATAATSSDEHDDTTTTMTRVAGDGGVAAAGVSRIVFDEQMRKLSIRNTDDVSWRGLTDDALSQRATLLQSRQYYIDVPTTRPADTTAAAAASEHA